MNSSGMSTHVENLMITFESDAPLPRPSSVETSLSPFARLLPTCAYLPSLSSFDRAVAQRYENCLHICLAREVRQQRRIELPSIMFYLLLSPSILALEIDYKNLTLDSIAMVVLSVATFQLLEPLLVVCLPSLSMRVVAMQMMRIMRCTTSVSEGMTY